MEGTVITKKGIQLLAKIIASKSMLNITRTAVGTGKLLKGYDPASMIQLVEYKMDAVISGCSANGEIAEITMQISSVGIEKGFLVSEVGVFAEDPDEGEILYAYIDMSDDLQYIYPEGGGTIKFVEITLDIVIAEGTKVTAFINPSGLVTREEMEAHVQNKDNPHETTKEQIGLGNADNTADIDKPVSTAQQEALEAAKEQLKAAIGAHIADKNNPHNTTKDQIGLGNADNTADIDKPVSTSQRAALDDLYQQLTAYTQQKIAELINGAPTSMDTLKEVSDAIAAHKSVMDALDAAIGKKANAAEFDSHIKDATKHITTAERNAWNGKQAAIIGGASTIVTSNLTASRALVSDGSGKVAASAVTAAELSHLSGARAGIQGQIDELNTGLDGKLGVSDTAKAASKVTDAGNRTQIGLQYSGNGVSAADWLAVWDGYNIKAMAASRIANLHTHDDRYYTESEIDTKLGGKANNSHTHTKSQITDFPSSLPASDVYAWAKASSKPSYSWGEITGKPSSFTPTGHTHDDRYYTESEINTKLAGKSDSDHTHNKVPFADRAGFLGSPIILIIGNKNMTLNAGYTVEFTLKEIGAANAYHEHSNYFAGADSGVISVDRIQPKNGAGDATVNVCAAALQSRNKSNSAWAPMYASAFTVQSSRRYKDNIIDMDADTAKLLLQYRVCTYDYKNPEDGQSCQGLIAEEVAEINPYPVIFKDGVADGLDYSRFVPQLIKMVQLQQQRITSLEVRVAKLEELTCKR